MNLQSLQLQSIFCNRSMLSLSMLVQVYFWLDVHKGCDRLIKFFG